MEINGFIPISKALKSRSFQFKLPTSERAYWIDITAKMLNKPFKQIFFLTAIWPLSWIKDFYGEAKSANNPQALWFWLRKQTLHTTQKGGEKNREKE